MAEYAVAGLLYALARGESPRRPADDAIEQLRRAIGESGRFRSYAAGQDA